MAENIIQNNTSRLLLVEGKDEVAFFQALADELGLSDLLQIEYFEAEGSNLRESLMRVVIDPNFGKLEHIGIIRDAEYDPDPFGSVCSAIEAANQKHPRNQLPVPEKELIPVGDELKMTVMLLPGDGLEGMLEDLILSAYVDDPSMTCVDQYFTCLRDQDVEIIANRLPKARMRVYLVSKIVSIPKSKKDTWLADIYRREWWSWDKPAFDRVKEFLKQLAGDANT